MKQIKAIASTFILVMAFCSPAARAADDTAKPEAESEKSRKVLPIPEDLTEQIWRSENIGHMLYVLDKTGAVGTDVMRTKTSEAERAVLGGYLPIRNTDENGNLKPSYSTLFFNRESPARIVYSVTLEYKKEAVFEAFNPAIAPSPEIAAMIAARQAALDALPPLTQMVNPVVLPGKLLGEDGTIVYCLAAATKPHTVVWGKHFRVLVDTDGKTVKSVTPLSKTAMEASLLAPDGTKLVMAAITHLVTDYPMETHVWNNLMLGLPVVVITERGMWDIIDGHISFVRKR